MITIDGSFGEGGGQILRSALALSLCTGEAFTIERIRAARDKPGLMRQHLTAVQAAAAISGATVQGEAVGSVALTFKPGAVKPGEYRFAVGTAGSTTLVLQTVLPALLTASGRSELVLEGGTHNPFAPPFDFLRLAFVPLINRMGPRVSVACEKPGFYPAGGGRLRVAIEPAAKLSGFSLLERGAIQQTRARALVANIPHEIGRRELAVIERRLGWCGDRLALEEATDSAGPGNLVSLEVESDHVTEVFTGFGEKRRSAEAVAEQASQQCRRYLAHSAPVGEFLADQLMLPLALAGAGVFRCVTLSRHAQTQMALIGQFLTIPLRAQKHDDGCVSVMIGSV